MPIETPISLAVEDELSENVLRVVLESSSRSFVVSEVHGRKGSGYLRKMLGAFNNASKGHAHLLCTDLDAMPCVTALLEDWFGCRFSECLQRKHHNLILVVARREIESWVMADRERFAQFLGVRADLIPSDVDGIQDPKRVLLQIASRSRHRKIREDLVPKAGEARVIGPNYNGCLAEFMRTKWRCSAAMSGSPSLRWLKSKIDHFQPLLTSK